MGPLRRLAAGQFHRADTRSHAAGINRFITDESAHIVAEDSKQLRTARISVT